MMAAPPAVDIIRNDGTLAFTSVAPYVLCYESFGLNPFFAFSKGY